MCRNHSQELTFPSLLFKISVVKFIGFYWGTFVDEYSILCSLSMYVDRFSLPKVLVKSLKDD